MSECRTEMEFKLKAKEIEKRGEKHKRLRLQKRFGNERVDEAILIVSQDFNVWWHGARIKADGKM